MFSSRAYLCTGQGDVARPYDIVQERQMSVREADDCRLWLVNLYQSGSTQATRAPETDVGSLGIQRNEASVLGDCV